MARAQSPCKPHSRTNQLHRQCNRNRIREQGSEGAADRAPVSPLSPFAPVSPLSPFAPSFPAAPARAHTSAMRWAALRGRCHNRPRTDPNCPAYPKAAAQPHDRRQRAECPRQTDAALTQKAYSRQCGLPRQHKGCQHSADTCCASCTSWARGTCHTQPHAAVVRCFCPRCDAYPRNDPKGADVFARQRTANPVPVAQRGKACRIGVWLAAAARPKYRILTCCALDALSSCKCPLTPESRQRIAPLVQRSSTTDATQRPLTHSAIPRGREMPPKHGSASAHSLPPRVVRHKPPCDACGACAASVCRFGEDVQMCYRRARTGVALLALLAFRAGRTRRT